MNELFLKIINMSISASWLVLAVLILRLVLKKAPKWVNGLLWGIVAVRLLFPFSIESALSLIPSAETIPVGIEMDATPAIDSGINAINSVVNPMIRQFNTPAAGASINPLQITVAIFAFIWVLGVAALLIYTAISYWRLRTKVSTAVILRDNTFQSENVSSPFVLGIIKPKIYLPFKIDKQDMEHVVAHELAHIRRRDHWWKPLGFLLLTIHWFNPLMWLAYVLLCRDIELACDEKVIKELGSEQRADYTQALLSCSVNRRMIAACPLAFGEVGVKERVKSVMNYKKPAFWIIVLAVAACVAVAVCFLTDPKEPEPLRWTQELQDGAIESAEIWTDSGTKSLTQTEIEELSQLLVALDEGDFELNKGTAGGTPVYGLKIHTSEKTYYLNEAGNRLETDINDHRWWIYGAELFDYILELCDKAGETASGPVIIETVPYTVKISRTDIPIFDGPGYDYTYVGTVQDAGTYTIVEEQLDYEGILWGKLKSGAGWIDIAEARSEGTNHKPITAGFADEQLLSNGNYHEFIADDSEYMVKLAFRSGESLKNVRFYSLQYEGGTYGIMEELHTLSELSPDVPLVTGVVFYGDMTTYGISFTDAGGRERHFAVSISGRNGALVLEEYFP